MDKVRRRETPDRKTSASSRPGEQGVPVDGHSLSSTPDRICSLHSRDDRRSYYRSCSSEPFLRHPLLRVTARLLLTFLRRDNCTPHLHWQRSDGPLPRLETDNGGLT